MARHAGERIGRQDRVVGGRIVDGRDDLGQRPPELGLVEDDLDMLGADRLRRGAGGGALVGDIAIGKADRERLDRPLGEARHHHQHRRRIDPARQEHAEWDIGALVDAHALHERGVEPGQRLVLVERLGAALGQRGAAAALDHAALAHDHRLAGQYPVDAGKDRLSAGGELHLQQFVARRAHQRRRHQPSVDQRARLGGKGKGGRRLGVIERLDAERVARQDQPPSPRVVQGQRIHAAQMGGEIEPVPAIEVERQLAIRLRRKRGRAPAAQLVAQLDVVVDLAIADQRRPGGLVQRLVAGRQVDDGEPCLHHPDIAGAVAAVAVGAAMAQGHTHDL